MNNNMPLHRTLIYLEQIKHNLQYVDYNMIYQSIAELGDKFAPTTFLEKDSFIDRVRINKKDEIFKNIHSVSYIHNKDILEKYVDFGRANKPKQAVFYGSIISPEIEMARATAYLETSEIIQNLDNYKEIEEVFTVSRWKVLKDIEILDVCFSNKITNKSEYSNLSKKRQTKFINHFKLKKHYKEQNIFFSNEFARNDIRNSENYKYKISAAFANYIWENTKLKGITYPSVQSQYQGQNIVLLPEIVENYLELEKVTMFKFEKKEGENLPIDCFNDVLSFGKNFMDFTWEK